MNAKTSNERQQALVERRKAQGLKQIRNLWAKPADEARIRAYVAKLNKAKETP